MRMMIQMTIKKHDIPIDLEPFRTEKKFMLLQQLITIVCYPWKARHYVITYDTGQTIWSPEGLHEEPKLHHCVKQVNNLNILWVSGVIL